MCNQFQYHVPLLILQQQVVTNKQRVSIRHKPISISTAQKVIETRLPNKSSRGNTSFQICMLSEEEGKFTRMSEEKSVGWADAANLA
jgi:hypothetical protein